MTGPLVIDTTAPPPAPESPPEATGPAFRSPAAEQQFRAVAGETLTALDQLPEGARGAAMAAIAADPTYSHFFSESEGPTPESRPSPQAEMTSYLRQHHGPPGPAPGPAPGQSPQAGGLRADLAGYLRQQYGNA